MPDREESRLTHRFTLVVRAEDEDELGHVNNTVYLRYIEEVARAHAEHLGLGITVMRGFGAVPVVRRHVLTYHRPARAGDTLEVSTRIVQAGGIRARRHNEVRNAATGELLVDADTDWVWVDPDSGRPKAVPAGILDAFGGPVKPD